MLFRSYRLVGAAKKAGCALGSRQRGRLTSHPERERIVTLIREALAAGARLQRACNEAGICLRTWRRWLRITKPVSVYEPGAAGFVMAKCRQINDLLQLSLCLLIN